jgi:hypothetical protein
VVSRRSQPVTSIVCEGYAPFEQYADTGQQGAWTDLYGLAAVLYRCVTGKKPPNAPDRSLVQGSDPCLCLASMYSGQYSKEFLRLIDKALAVDIPRRFRTATEWRVALGSPPAPAENAERTAAQPKPAPERRPAPQSAPRPEPVSGPPSKGLDVQQDLHLTPQEASAGVERAVAFERQVLCSACGGRGQARSQGRTSPCPTCFGRGHAIKRAQVRVSLPPRTPHGATLSSPGQGHAGLHGGPSGDLHIRVQVAGAAPAQWNAGVAPPHENKPYSAPSRGGNRGAALTSLLLPGIGSVPSTAIVPSMMYLLCTMGLYFIAVRLWVTEYQYAWGAAIAPAVLHLGAVVAGWRTAAEPAETKFLPRAFTGWLATLFLVLLLCWEATSISSESLLGLGIPLPGGTAGTNMKSTVCNA